MAILCRCFLYPRTALRGDGFGVVRFSSAKHTLIVHDILDCQEYYDNCFWNSYVWMCCFVAWMWWIAEVRGVLGLFTLTFDSSPLMETFAKLSRLIDNACTYLYLHLYIDTEL